MTPTKNLFNKILILTCFIFICQNIALGQPNLKKKSIAKGNIYALIIGISDYENPEIPDLRFAHTDAIEFANFLTSKAGGKVPSKNIKLLTNEKATISNVYVAKKWLEENAKKDDMVFFYFSGHGDVESGLYNTGFLLAHDSPKGNYQNNAIRIEDFNNMANTLSVLKGVQVVFITDACRSGTLAGSDNRGRSLVGDQLSKSINNEIRIASCGSDELAQEDTAWGGGRGVFSYYLINGLKGLADTGEKDKKITLSELRSYLELNVSKDVFELKDQQQVPIIEGKPLTRLANVKSDVLAQIEGNIGMDAENSSGQSRSVDFVPSLEDQYFTELQKVKLKEEVDFSKWVTMPPKKLAEEVIKKYKFEGHEKWKDNLKQSIGSDKNLSSFQQQLAATIHTEVQKSINAYLSGDQNELKNRQYHNVLDNSFEEYIDMLKTAMQLIDEEDDLYSVLKVKWHYFTGLNARLNIAMKDSDRVKLITDGLYHQEQALQIDNLAPYVHHEIGQLCILSGHSLKSQLHLEKAIALAPQWASPKVNISRLYYNNQLYKEGETHATQAVQIQNDLPEAYLYQGKNAHWSGNHLLAKQALDNAEFLDDVNFEIYEGLGDLNLALTDYSQAELNYQRAEDIKDGLYAINDLRPVFDLPDNDAGGVIDMIDKELNSPRDPCIIDTSAFGANDIMAHVAYGYKQYLIQNNETAYRFFKRAIAIDPSNPIAYHYLGLMAHKANKLVAAEYCLSQAKEYEIKIFFQTGHIEDLVTSQMYLDCYVQADYTNALKSIFYNDMILADTYQKLKLYHKAEMLYKDIIDKDSYEKEEAYRILWNMLEKLGQHQSVEKIILKYTYEVANNNESELAAFYKRRISSDLYPSIYTYKLALLSYKKLENEDLLNNYSNFRSKFNQSANDKLLYATDEADDQTPFFIRSEDEIMPDVAHYFFQIPEVNQAKAISEEFTTDNNQVIELFENIDHIVDSLPLSDIHFKLGVTYNKIGYETKSKENFDLAFEYNPNNASSTIPLIAYHIAKNNLITAYDLMSYLYSKNRLDYNHTLMLAEYVVLAGDFTRADSVLHTASDHIPNIDENLLHSKGLRHLLDKQYEKAIIHFEQRLAENENDFNTLYTLARIYAAQSKNDEAEEYLARAAGSGFYYKWILKYDPMIKSIRDSDIYVDLTADLNNSNN